MHTQELRHISDVFSRGRGTLRRSFSPACDKRQKPINKAQEFGDQRSERGAAIKLRPIRFFWIQATLQSWTVAPLAITRRKRAGTKAGLSTSMAAPSAEMFRTTQLMTEPPTDT